MKREKDVTGYLLKSSVRENYGPGFLRKRRMSVEQKCRRCVSAAVRHLAADSLELKIGGEVPVSSHASEYFRDIG